MHSPWQHVSSHPVDQHMGVYCFGTSPSRLCVPDSVCTYVSFSFLSRSACPHVILDYVNIHKAERAEGEQPSAQEGR